MIPRKNEYPARHRAGVVKNRGARCASPKGLSCFISPSLFKPLNLAFIYIIYTYTSHPQPSTIYHNFTRFTLLIRSTIHSAKTLQNISETASGKYRIIVIFYRIPFLHIHYHLLPFCVFGTIQNVQKSLYFHRISVNFLQFIDYFIEFCIIPEIFIISLDISSISEYNYKNKCYYLPFRIVERHLL